ncbi:Uncharacterized protein TCM_042166 [Theobroma cacao]|uniref:Uncharacterized protein n=1 Tax=Theobroma cacao TaxID=3641 RepID=A0A061GYD0_THECC|nr:Uncharacterized protein TCM_042166 [Theobroma cacao]
MNPRSKPTNTPLPPPPPPPPPKLLFRRKTAVFLGTCVWGWYNKNKSSLAERFGLSSCATLCGSSCYRKGVLIRQLITTTEDLILSPMPTELSGAILSGIRDFFFFFLLKIWSMRTGFFMIAVLKHVPTASKTLLEGEEGDG